MTNRTGALSVEARWADRRLERWVVGQGRLERLVVGSRQLPLADSRLPAQGLVLASADGTVQLLPGMPARLHGPHGVLELGALVASGRCVPRASMLALELERGERLQTELGGLTLEVGRVRPLGLLGWGAPSEGVLRTANIGLGVLLLSGLFAIEVSTRERAADDDDRLSSPEARVAKYLPVAAPNPPPAASKPASPSEAPARSPPRGVKASARARAAPARGGLPSLGAELVGLGRAGLGGALTDALGNLQAAGPRAGLLGLGLRGAGGAGPGGELIGLGGLRTHAPGAGLVEGRLTKARLGPAPEPEVDVAGCEEGGCLTRELIRKVIASHRDQLRYCYESLLNRLPTLGGKVAMRFLIRAQGEVAEAEVTESSARNPLLERCLAQRVRSWVFPAAKRPSQVTYPFVFHSAGG